MVQSPCSSKARKRFSGGIEGRPTRARPREKLRQLLQRLIDRRPQLPQGVVFCGAPAQTPLAPGHQTARKVPYNR